MGRRNFQCIGCKRWLNGLKIPAVCDDCLNKPEGAFGDYGIEDFTKYTSDDEEYQVSEDLAYFDDPSSSFEYNNTDLNPFETDLEEYKFLILTNEEKIEHLEYEEYPYSNDYYKRMCDLVIESSLNLDERINLASLVKIKGNRKSRIFLLRWARNDYDFATSADTDTILLRIYSLLLLSNKREDEELAHLLNWQHLEDL